MDFIRFEQRTGKRGEEAEAVYREYIRTVDTRIIDTRAGDPTVRRRTNPTPVYAGATQTRFPGRGRITTPPSSPEGSFHQDRSPDPRPDPALLAGYRKQHRLCRTCWTLKA